MGKPPAKAKNPEKRRWIMSDPHSNDYCVVCGETPSVDGPKMHPIPSIECGVICETHVTERKDSAAYGGYQ